jgi:hypothetical protein
MYQKINILKDILDIWKANKNLSFRREWKTLTRKVINKGYDADKLQIILSSEMIDKIVKTSPSKTYKHYQIGKIVQIRRNAGINGTDLVLLRIPNGLLIPFSNCAFFTLDEKDNDHFETFYNELYKNIPELNHEERCFTYADDGNKKNYLGSIIEYDEPKTRELLNAVAILTQNLHIRTSNRV